jgi:hypothetical protein
MLALPRLARSIQDNKFMIQSMGRRERSILRTSLRSASGVQERSPRALSSEGVFSNEAMLMSVSFGDAMLLSDESGTEEETPSFVVTEVWDIGSPLDQRPGNSAQTQHHIPQYRMASHNLRRRMVITNEPTGIRAAAAGDGQRHVGYRQPINRLGFDVGMRISRMRPHAGLLVAYLALHSSLN